MEDRRFIATKKGERKTSGFNPHYPKFVVKDDGNVDVVDSGTPTLATGDFVLDPPDDNFGKTYYNMVVEGSTKAYVIRYQAPPPTISPYIWHTPSAPWAAAHPFGADVPTSSAYETTLLISDVTLVSGGGGFPAS